MITGMRLWFSWATSATWSTLSRVNDRSPRTRSRKQWKNGQTANTPRSRVNGRLKVRFVQLLRDLFCLFFSLLNFLLELHKTPSKTEAVEKPLKKVNTVFRELITHHEQYFDYLPHEKTFTQQLQRLFGITNQQIHINTKSWTFFDSNLLVS